jgi:hypothetical protein
MNLQNLSRAINQVSGKEIAYSPVKKMLIVNNKSVIFRNGVTYIGNQMSFRATGLRDLFDSLRECRVNFSPSEVESILALYHQLNRRKE